MAGTFDCIIVLGYPDLTSMQSRILKSRLDLALGLYRRGLSKRIMVTGGGTRVRSGPTEADAMRSYLVGRGVRPGAIVRERRSKNTIGNAAFTKQMVKSCASVAIVTSEFHVRRARYIFRKLYGSKPSMRFFASATPSVILHKAVVFERASLRHVVAALRGIGERSTSAEVSRMLAEVSKSPMTPEMKRLAWY